MSWYGRGLDVRDDGCGLGCQERGLNPWATWQRVAWIRELYPYHYMQLAPTCSHALTGHSSRFLWLALALGSRNKAHRPLREVPAQPATASEPPTHRPPQPDRWKARWSREGMLEPLRHKVQTKQTKGCQTSRAEKDG